MASRVWSWPSGLAAAMVAGGIVLASTVSAQEMTETERRLLELIEEQQRQLDLLREELETLRDARPPAPAPVADVPEEPEAPVIRSGAPEIALTISGQVNQAFNLAADGDTTKGYFVDNDVSNTRLRIEGAATFVEGPVVGSTLEIGVSPNNSYDVSQDNEAADDFFDARVAELWVRDDAWGKFSFGQGSAAADDTAEYDLSLVAGPIMYSGVADIVGGLQFTDGSNLTGITVGDAFFNFDGDRFGRLRYDSPMFGPFQLSASAGSDQRYDAALTFGGDYGDWTGVDFGNVTTLGAIAIRDPSDDTHDWVATASFSALHNPSGLSLAVSGGFGGGADGDEPFNLYGKLGWDTDLIRFGTTGFGVDYTFSENVSDEGDQAQSIGLAVVQLIEQYGIELYGQLRWFTLDRDQAPNVDDIVVGTLGTRIRF